jgi:hypothetical protein
VLVAADRLALPHAVRLDVTSSMVASVLGMCLVNVSFCFVVFCVFWWGSL